jgi:hypothetical protein
MPDLTHYLNDAVTAVPASLARILLGNRKEPSARLLSIAQKIAALVGSLFFAVMAGQIARSFAQTSGYATLIVIAAAFTAQDSCTALVRRTKQEIRDRSKTKNENSDPTV